MKNFVCGLLLCIFFFNVQAQDTTKKAQTRIEQLAEREGIVLKKEFTRIGSVDGVAIDLLTISDVNTSNSIVKGLKFSTSAYLSGMSTVERSSFVDADEINGILKFIEYAKQLNTPPPTYTEYVYTTKGDFKAAVYSETDSKREPTGEWKIIIYTDKYYSNSANVIRKKNVEEFYSLLSKATQLVK